MTIASDLLSNLSNQSIHESRTRNLISKRRVLVVEDDLDTRHALHIQLDSVGHEVTMCTDGRNILAVVQKLRPDAVILDLGMPFIDGFEVLAKLRAARSPVLAKTIILSARDEGANKSRALDAGAHAYLRKPVPFADLQAALSSVFADRKN